MSGTIVFGKVRGITLELSVPVDNRSSAEGLSALVNSSSESRRFSSAAAPLLGEAAVVSAEKLS